MLFGFALTALTAASLVAAETQQVVVGMNMTRSFMPNSIIANVGDVVNFTFVAGNHSVVSSSFAMPCTMGNGSVNSGFMPANITAGRTSSYQVTINSTDPMWLYCSQGNHCSVGMVMSINAPTSGNMTFNAFQAAANATAATTTTNSSTGSSSSSMSATSSIASGSASAASTSKTGGANALQASGLLCGVLAAGSAMLVM